MLPLLVLVASARAGVWVREPGHSYVQLGYTRSTVAAAFTEEGQRLPLGDDAFLPSNFEQVFERGTYTSDTWSAYGELGVLPELELFGALPYAFARSSWSFQRGADVLVLENRGLTDAVAGLRWGRGLGPIVVAAAGSVRLPLYDNAPEVLGLEAGNVDIYDDRPPLGQGTIDVDSSAAVGVPFPFGWSQLEAGVRVRDRRYATQIPVRLQVGAKPVSFWSVFADAGWLATLGNGDQTSTYQDDYNKGPAILDRQQSLELGLGSHVRPLATVSERTVVTGLGLSIRASSLVLGKRIGAVHSLGASVTWER